MGNESLFAQFQVDIGEGRLIAIEAVEADLGLHGRVLTEFAPARAEHRQLTALDVDLQQVDRADLLDVVQPSGVHRMSAGDLGERGKVDEQVELIIVRRQQTGESRGCAQVQRVATAVAHRVREVPLVRARPVDGGRPVPGVAVRNR